MGLRHYGILVFPEQVLSQAWKAWGSRAISLTSGLWRQTARRRIICCTFPIAVKGGYGDTGRFENGWCGGPGFTTGPPLDYGRVWSDDPWGDWRLFPHPQLWGHPRGPAGRRSS